MDMERCGCDGVRVWKYTEAEGRRGELASTEELKV